MTSGLPAAAPTGLDALRRALHEDGAILDDLELDPEDEEVLHARFRAREGVVPASRSLPLDDPGLGAIVGEVLARRRGGRDRDLAGQQPPGDRELDPVAELGAWGDNPRDEGDSELVPLDLGPLHPITRGRFRLLLKLDGEEILRAAVETGYARRGLEALAPRRGWTSFLPLMDRWCERSGLFGRLAWCQVLERFAGLRPPRAALRLRVVAAEIERLAAHAETIAETAGAFGATLATRTLARAGEELRAAWARIGAAPGRPCPGGFEGGPEDAAELRRGLEPELSFLVAALGAAHAATMENAAFLERARGLGRLGPELARALGASGPVLRAAGIDCDARHDEEDSPWRQGGLRPESALERDGDLAARTGLRFAEMRASLRLVDRVFDEGWTGPRSRRDPRLAAGPAGDEDLAAASWRVARATGDLRFAAGWVRVRVEAPQGTLGVAARANEAGRLAAVRLRGPGLFHLSALTRVAPGSRLPDLAALVAGFDLLGGDIDG